MFTFYLAERLGMTRRQLLQVIDSAELSEWVAVFRIREAPPEPDVEEELIKVFGNPAKRKGQVIH